MKKIISIILICAVLCTLSGCRVIQVADGINMELKASKVANEQAGIILDCFKTGNSEELEALFCEKISLSHDLKAEIAEAIEFIDGNIIDDGTWIGMSSGGEAVDNGEITMLSIHPTMHHVKNDTGKEYLIMFDSYLIHDRYPNEVGMTYIAVKNDDDGTVFIGGD